MTVEDVVETYAELRQCVSAFKQGVFEVLFIIGDQGQSKSTIVREFLPKSNTADGNQWLKGGDVTAFELYKRLYESRDRTFVLDDCDSFYSDRTMVRLMKALCETEPVKTIGWHTHNLFLDREGIPKAFETRSRVVIIANRSHEISKHVASLEDRGLMVHFRPSVAEVIKLGRSFIKDREVVAFAEKHAHYVDGLSLRAMETAARMKRAGMAQWKRALATSLKIDRLLMVEELLADRSFLTDLERAREFNRRTREEDRPGAALSTWNVLKKRVVEARGARKRPGKAAI